MIAALPFMRAPIHHVMIELIAVIPENDFHG
jgi:hypothetical protein